MQTLKASRESHQFEQSGLEGGELFLASAELNLETFIFQKVLNVQAVAQSSLRQKNVVWICKEDLNEICSAPSTSSIKPNYIQIADQVYRVMAGNIRKGWIALSNLQIDNMGDAIFANELGGRSVSAAPFDPENVKTFPLEKAVIRVTEEALHGDGTGKIVIAKDQIKEALKEKLRSEFLAKNKLISIGFPWGELRAEVATLFPSPRNVGDQLSFGVITEKTEFHLLPAFSKQVVIVDDIFREEVVHFDFKITLQKRFSSANSNLFPIVLSTEEIQQHIKKELTGKLLCKGQEIIIPHSSGWDIHVRLSNCVLDPKVKMIKKETVLHEELEEGFVLAQSSDIRLEAGNEVLLTRGQAQIPDVITFKVADIPSGVSHPTINQDKERWVNVEELKSALQARERPFVLNETFEATLSSGTYFIKVTKVKSEEIKDSEDKKYVNCWKISDKRTYLEIEAEKELEVNLLRDLNPLPVRKATLQISGKKISEDGVNVSVADLKKLIAAQAPKRIVKNQSFDILTEFEDRLELKLLDVEFAGDPEFEKDRTAFGTFNEASDLDFCTSSPLGKINIIDKVYDKEVEQLKISLTAVKRKGLSKVARTPLVVDQQEIIKKIRKEFKEYKYLLEGFTFTIPYGDGWDIQAKFVKGVLSKETEGKKSENRFTQITTKKGYVCGDETPIDFVPYMKDVALVKGEAKTATSLNVRVIEVLENHNKNLDTFVKGNWINLEELKKALEEYPRHIAKKERIVVELESGKFLLEVKNAKGEGLASLSQKEIGGLQWKVDPETKINVAIEKTLDLQKVKDGERHPLKKIEFTVFPEEQTGEHLSLKDLEIKQALKDLLPLKIIKDHVLSLETEGNHTLRLAVKEMKLNEEGIGKKDTGELFGLITDETEIVLKGKEESNLAIRTSPKILEVKDPIKYLEDRGIGGIDEKFKQIYRIFFSRSEKLGEEALRRGTKPIKGILLYGPPGTGKTTLARNIGEMLGCSGEQLNMLTATEIFNMWFGQSEENIRTMFAPAREAQKKYGKDSPLYIVVIDEIDALLPKRGGNVNKVRDSLVNQFLGEMDGLNELNNLLVIGITNRKEDIDDAALRHGRFGVHVEIGLPDQKGREKIFEIHTKQLRKEKLLDEKVDFKTLAAETENFSGADIEGLVEEASLLSLERLNGLDCSKEDLKSHKSGLVTMEDFEKALEGRKNKGSGKLPYPHMYT